MRQSSLNRIARHIALVAFGLSLTATPLTSQAIGIAIAWDASVDFVDGYVVHVGTRAGVYEQTFDVGQQTAFTFLTPFEGRRYYFVVTAHRAGISSPPSPEVFGLAGDVAPLEVPKTPPKTPYGLGTMSQGPGAGASRFQSRHSESVSVSCPDAEVCYAVRVRASSLQPVTSLASTPDGDLLVVEAGRSVRLIDGHGALDSVALEAPEGHRITDVVVAPGFASSGHVYVGVTHPGPGNTQHFSIVRFRHVQRRMGEAAVIVAALPVANSQSPHMAMDRLGRIYVAMPAGGLPRRDPYAGMILRFNADGTTAAAKSRAASAVLAAGFEIPLSLTADAETLWAVGFDSRWPNVIGRFPLDEPPETVAQTTPAALPDEVQPGRSIGARVIALSVSADGTVKGRQPLVAYIDTAPRLHVARLPAGAQPVLLRDDAGDLLTDAVFVGPSRRIYVAARTRDDVTLVLELLPQ